MIATQRATHKSPAVRLHISLTGELDQPQENIMKVTQDYEVVEVDGFVFKRKRKAMSPPQPAEPLEGYQETEQSRLEASTGPAASNQEIVQAVCGLDADGVMQQAQNLLDALPPGVPPRQALPMLTEGLAMAALQSVDIPEDLKSALMASWPPAAAAAVRHALTEGTLVCASGDATQQAALRDASLLNAKRMRKAALQARLDCLLAEEAEWKRLTEEHKRLAAAVGLPDEAAEAVEEAELGDEAQALAEDLASAREDAHRQVMLQVEGLSAMVSGVDELVKRAERQCNAMQKRWHLDKFRKFSHVDSPARLIKEIIQPSGLV